MIALIDDHRAGTGTHAYHRGLYGNLMAHGVDAAFYAVAGGGWGGLRWALRGILGMALDRDLGRLKDRGDVIIHVSNPNLAPLTKSMDVLVTVHDLYYLDRDSNSRLWSMYSRHNYRYIGSAKHIVTSSTDTAWQLVHRLGQDGGRISVVHPSVDPVFSPEGLRLEPRPGMKALLHVGYDTPNKNLKGLLSALSILPQEYILVRVGYDSPSTLRLIGRLGLGERVVHVRADTPERLADVYRGAHLFVFPSFYEGFGIPPLEAMGCGLPVVASLRGGLAESVGDAAMVVDPEDPRQMADEILSLEDGALRSKLVSKGLKRARSFGTGEQFSELIQAYRHAYPGLSIP